ncbi:S9 family peptidase [Aliidiomarina shirensis]|uniref:S9 family peptidase n=1 Tax=Aliidiomarina shirensis TaxID=1048642 RepID=A0A432WX05_9GAMM|nr:S9 family peptidase [Aliidiomarina shirensis]RUO38285.1 S9 family peptidase [Aliidiomarina shirensis]
MRIVTIILAAIIGGHGVAAQADTDVKPITLEEYARNAQFLDVKISPQANYLAATTRNEGGSVRLTVLDINSRSVLSATELRGNESVSSFHWVSDKRLVMSLAREFGPLEMPARTGEWFGMDVDGGRRIMLTGPRSRDGEWVAADVIDWLPDSPNEVLISTYAYSSSEPWLDISRMRVDSGRKRSEGRVPLRAVGGVQARLLTDSNGDPAVAVGLDPNNTNDIIIIVREPGRRGDWTEIARYPALEGGFTPLAFMDDNSVVGLSDTNSDTRAVAILNLENGDEEIIALHPDTDVTPIMSFNRGGANEVIGVSYEYETINALLFEDVEDREYSNVVQSLTATFPDRQVSVSSTTRDGNLMVVSVRSANHPTQFFLFDRENVQLTSLAEAFPWLKRDLLPQTRTVVYQSRDGLSVQGLLTLPRDKEAKDLPLIMLPHGGPHGIRDSIVNIDRDAKVFAQHGYAVFQPNFRGSGGFGRSFEEAGHKAWGTDMINDMTDGVMYLAEQGIVDKDRVCAYGASYGGFAALMSAIREPDLYKCTVGFVGVFDLNLMLTEGDIPTRQSGRDYLARVLPETEEGRNAQSPLHNLDQLKAPVFLIHGAEDVRVPIIHAERLREALEARNHPLEWMVKEDEGHGFYKPEHNVERWERMLTFFNRYIGEDN